MTIHPGRLLAPALAVATLALGGCAQSYKPGEPYFISTVDVTKAEPAIGNGALTSQVRSGITQYTSVQPREGAPKNLSVNVKRFRVQNPALALVIGDANSMTANATITNADGVVEWTQPIVVQSDAAFNGVIGAVVAVARKKDGVQAQLSERMANRVAKLAYGGKLPARRAAAEPTPSRTQPAPVARPEAPRQEPATSGVNPGV